MIWENGILTCILSCKKKLKKIKKKWYNYCYNNINKLRTQKFTFHESESEVAQSCPTLCDPMNPSMPGLPVHHQLPEFTQTHVHWVRDAIQPSHPLLSPSPPDPIPPSFRVFSSESTLPMRWPKYWSFSFSISPSNESSGLISFRMDWLDPELGLLEFGPMSLVFRVNREWSCLWNPVSRATVRVYLGQRLLADMLIILKKGKGRHNAGKGGPFNEPVLPFIKKHMKLARRSFPVSERNMQCLTRKRPENMSHSRKKPCSWWRSALWEVAGA